MPKFSEEGPSKAIQKCVEKKKKVPFVSSTKPLNILLYRTTTNVIVKKKQSSTECYLLGQLIREIIGRNYTQDLNYKSFELYDQQARNYEGIAYFMRVSSFEEMLELGTV